MTPSHIDHITVTSPTLAAGAAFVREALGVELQPGGEHPRMGTHNLLLRLGDALFLEVISPNPRAPLPDRPRWFGLDQLPPDAAPLLSAWVLRTADIQATRAASTEALGAIEPLQRGALNWRITIPRDGSVPLDGVGPALIQWDTGLHPASTLPDAGLSLERLDIFHGEPERVAALLRSLQADGPIAVRALPPGYAPGLVAQIRTPQGLRQLSVR